MNFFRKIQPTELLHSGKEQEYLAQSMLKQAKKPLLFVLALILFLGPLPPLVAKTSDTSASREDCAMTYEQADVAGHGMRMTGSDHCNNDSQCSDDGECRQNHCTFTAFSIAVDFSTPPAWVSSELISYSDLHLQDSLYISLYRPPRS